MDSLDIILWNEVLNRRETLIRVCNLPMGSQGRGAAKALAECQMQAAYQAWWNQVTR